MYFFVCELAPTRVINLLYSPEPSLCVLCTNKLKSVCLLKTMQSYKKGIKKALGITGHNTRLYQVQIAGNE